MSNKNVFRSLTAVLIAAVAGVGMMSIPVAAYANDTAKSCHGEKKAEQCKGEKKAGEKCKGEKCKGEKCKGEKTEGDKHEGESHEGGAH